MDEAAIADLKQFIAGVVTQQTSDIRLGMDDIQQDIQVVQQDIQGIHQDIQRLDQKIDDGFLGVAEALENMNTAVEGRFKDFDRRLGRLAQKAS